MVTGEKTREEREKCNGLGIYISSIGNKGSGPSPDRTPKGLPRMQTIGSYVETLPRRQTILYVRLDDFLGRASALPEARAPAAPK